MNILILGVNKWIVMKYSVSLLAIVFVVFFFILSDDKSSSKKDGTKKIATQVIKKELSLDEEFKKYVPKEFQNKCEGLNNICKKFYIGYYLFSDNLKTDLALKYFIESYENNISKIVEDSEANDYYLTDNIARLYSKQNDNKNAIKYLKLSIKAGNDRNICYLGREYDKLDMLKEAYDDNSYGDVENYNIGVYHGYLNDDIKYKFHMLKAANMGDKDALWYIGSSHLKGVSTT